MISKSIAETALPITEEDYRNDGAMHYSTLSTYRRTGFNGLETLFERKESPSLTFGSAVDSIITGGQKEFDERFLVCDIANVSPIIEQVVKSLFNDYSGTYTSLEELIASMPKVVVLAYKNADGRATKWKDETCLSKVTEDPNASTLYNMLYLAKGRTYVDEFTGNTIVEPDKTILTQETYQDVLNAVNALKTSPKTAFYFADNNEFDGIERQYQLKWAAEFNGINYSCMMDLVVVDNVNKTIQPIDLKTSSHYEWDFWQSFFDWNYWIQANQYASILKANLKEDFYFRDFTILPYKFIVVNKKTLCPEVFQWDHQFDIAEGDREYIYNDKKVIVTDFRNIGEELNYYLTEQPKEPKGIKDINNIDDFLPNRKL